MELGIKLTADTCKEPQGAGEAAHCAPEVMHIAFVRHLGGDHYGQGCVEELG